jgi:hypothetical protein
VKNKNNPCKDVTKKDSSLYKKQCFVLSAVVCESETPCKYSVALRTTNENIILNKK